MDRKHTDTEQSNPELYAQYPKALYKGSWPDKVMSAVVHTPEEKESLGKGWRLHPNPAYCKTKEVE